MKLKLARIIEMSAALDTLAANKMPPKSALRVFNNIIAIKPFMEGYNKVRTRLAEENGTLSADGTQYLLEGAGKANFSKQIGEVISEEVEVSFATLTFNDLGSGDIEPWVLVALDGVVFVSEDTKKSEPSEA